MNKNNVKELAFDSLPGDSSEWLIIGWGKIINELKGSYKQQIILRRLDKNDDPRKLIAINNKSHKIYHSVVDIGTIRIFSPGTIVQNQRIKFFVEDYLEKRVFRILDPQSLRKEDLRAICFDVSLPGMLSDLERINTRCFEPSDQSLSVIIPCSVIADYYCFGMSPLTKAILDGMMDLHIRTRNTVFNPNRVLRAISTTKKRVAYIELERKMFLEDKVKIARLAHDDFFWGKCMGIFTSLVMKDTSGSFIDMDFPINEATDLSVYGAVINGKFLVHSIAACSALLPFDVLIAGKPFKGKGQLNNPSEEDPIFPRDTILINTQPPKRKLRTRLDRKDAVTVSGGRPKWDGNSEILTYNKDQSSSFSEHDAINEKDFTDFKKTDQIIEFVHKHGLAFALSTNPDKLGNENILQLNLFAKGPFIPPKQLPTDSFSIIEKLTGALETMLRNQKRSVKVKICCPVEMGDDPYTAFPIESILSDPALNTVENLNFCFMQVKKMGHVLPRRVFIKQLNIEGSHLYIMDVEPKYNDKIKGFVSSFGVIFDAGRIQLTEEELKEILIKIVATRKTSESQWQFLKTSFGFTYLKIQHRKLETGYHNILKFLSELGLYAY